MSVGRFVRKIGVRELRIQCAITDNWPNFFAAVTVSCDMSGAVLRAFFADMPKRRYVIAPNERKAEITIKKGDRSSAAVRRR
jgi:hypothetical protein